MHKTGRRQQLGPFHRPRQQLYRHVLFYEPHMIKNPGSIAGIFFRRFAAGPEGSEPEVQEGTVGAVDQEGRDRDQGEERQHRRQNQARVLSEGRPVGQLFLTQRGLPGFPHERLHDREGQHEAEQQEHGVVSQVIERDGRGKAGRSHADEPRQPRTEVGQIGGAENLKADDGDEEEPDPAENAPGQLPAVGETPREQLLRDDQNAVVQAPQDEMPAGAVPQARGGPDDQKIQDQAPVPDPVAKRRKKIPAMLPGFFII